MRVIAAYPLFGVGLGDQAYLSLAEHFRVLAQTKPLAEPDNSYLQWGAIAGIPVMLIFLALLALVFWFSWRNWLAIDTRYRPLFAGGIVALVALSINSLTVDGWTSPIDVQFLGWLIAGIVTSPFIGRCLVQSVPPVDRTSETTRVPVRASWMDKAKQGSQL
jgi:O-antigen ligase